MNNKTKKKLEIIKASIDLMYLKGYNGTSVKDITDVAGIPKGSFYNYFADKENYAVEAIRYYYTVTADSKFLVLRDVTRRPLERIKMFFEMSISTLEENGLKYGCFVGNLSQEMGDVNEVIANATASFYEKVTTTFVDTLQEAKEHGDLISEIDMNILGGFIVSSWQGALIQMKVSRSKRPLDDYMIMLEKVILL